MSSYRIISKAGTDHGVWTGDTKEQALDAMREDGGDGDATDGSSTVGTVEDWIFEEVESAELIYVGAADV
jgi:hypothetical protein